VQHCVRHGVLSFSRGAIDDTEPGRPVLGAFHRQRPLPLYHGRMVGYHWRCAFEDHLRPFNLGRCGFAPTAAGLIKLRP
jgi:hypothetical protein